VGPFIIDFYCEELRWVIEIDGGQHNTSEARLYDEQHTQFLEGRGMHVSRYWSHEVLEDSDALVEGLASIAVRLRGGEGTLTPLPEGEGDRQ
jgi:very-short-patch-repair endonuclease